MPPIGRRKSVSSRPPGEAGAPPEGEIKDAELDALVSNCLAAHAIIDEHGTPAMRRLIDLLLFEIGSEIGTRIEGRRRTCDLN